MARKMTILGKRGSGNIFADLRLPNAEMLMRQALSGNMPKLSIAQPRTLAWSLTIRASERPWNVNRRPRRGR